MRRDADCYKKLEYERLERKFLIPLGQKMAQNPPQNPPFLLKNWLKKSQSPPFFTKSRENSKKIKNLLNLADL